MEALLAGQRARQLRVFLGQPSLPPCHYRHGESTRLSVPQGPAVWVTALNPRLLLSSYLRTYSVRVALPHAKHWTQIFRPSVDTRGDRPLSALPRRPFLCELAESLNSCSIICKMKMAKRARPGEAHPNARQLPEWRLVHSRPSTHSS